MEEEEGKKSRHRHKQIPERDADLISVSETVTDNWPEDMPLKWIDVEGLRKATADYRQSFTARNANVGSRIAITEELKQINAEIDDSISYLKGYINEIYSKQDAPKHYSEFGLVKQGSGYRLPRDNDRRLYSLDILLEALAKHNIVVQKYGKKHWDILYGRFTEARARASISDKSNSTYINTKADNKAIVIKTLNSLVHLVKAHYPDSWKDMLRVWGFRKEKY